MTSHAAGVVRNPMHRAVPEANSTHGSPAAIGEIRRWGTTLVLLHHRHHLGVRQHRLAHPREYEEAANYKASGDRHPRYGQHPFP